ncbi:MAG: hypothetical protein OER77_03485 [Myxococcales bacterium]|nr:hypothetical protein [Myxococcales bacterium]
MPEDPNRPPSDPSPTAPGGDKRNIGLWVGLGCLGVVISSCCLLSYWAQTFGFRWILNQSDETRSWASRVVLTGALEGIRSTCVEGVASEDVQSWFHPDMTSEARNRLCGIDEATIQKIAAPDQVAGELLAAIGEPDMAARFGMDPALCYRYATETTRIIGCFEQDAGSRVIPYKIIDVEQPQR